MAKTALCIASYADALSMTDKPDYTFVTTSLTMSRSSEMRSSDSAASNNGLKLECKIKNFT